MFDHTGPSTSAAALALRGGIRPGPLSRRRVGLLGRIFGLLLDWSERARMRSQLEGLSDHSLRDIGITRADVSREIAKPFWQY